LDKHVRENFFDTCYDTLETQMQEEELKRGVVVVVDRLFESERWCTGSG
jgi:hypothetical protein